MICLCGYAYEEWSGQSEDNEKYVGKRIGKKKFKEISGKFVLENYYESYYGQSDGDEEVSLYACPECNTIHMKD